MSPHHFAPDPQQPARRHRTVRSRGLIPVAGALFALALASAALPAPAAGRDADRFLEVRSWQGTFWIRHQADDRENLIGGFTSHTRIANSVEGRFTFDREEPGLWSGRGEATWRVDERGEGCHPRTPICSSTVVRGEGRVALDDESDLEIDPWSGTFELAIFPGGQDMEGLHVEYDVVPLGGVMFDDGGEMGMPRPTEGGFTNSGPAGIHSLRPDSLRGYFDHPLPLPASGLVFCGSVRRRDGTEMGWTIWPAGQPEPSCLRADAGGPYRVERGGTVELDGSRSDGNIRDFRWTFEPVGDCPLTHPGAEGAAARHDIVALCEVQARLTVSDGAASDTAAARIEVAPRDWSLPVEHAAEEGELPNARPPYVSRGSEEGTTFSGGANVCAEDGGGEHTLHPPAGAAGSWEGSGYQVERLEDPAGPFHGAWWVKEHTLRIHRQTLVNPFVLPGARGPRSDTVPNFYSVNAERGRPVEAYLAAIREHEHEHTRLMGQAAADDDPVERLEALVAAERDELRQRADRLLRDGERAICERAADPLDELFGKDADHWFYFVYNDTWIYDYRSEVSVGGPGTMTFRCD